VTRPSLREYAAVQRERYLAATRAEKGTLLNEVVTVTGLHRKAAIRLLRRPPRAPTARSRAGRPPVYGSAGAQAHRVGRRRPRVSRSRPRGSLRQQHSVSRRSGVRSSRPGVWRKRGSGLPTACASCWGARPPPCTEWSPAQRIWWPLSDGSGLPSHPVDPGPDRASRLLLFTGTERDVLERLHVGRRVGG
jgi:hypothetical protein